MPARIRCRVLEVPAQDDWLSRRGCGPRELLPWADPYIAGLMRRLEDRSAPGDDDASDPFAFDDATSSPEFDPPSADWQQDAFMPRPLEPLRVHSYPPIYGGFPLLENE
jgi:hypothetical protein